MGDQALHRHILEAVVQITKLSRIAKDAKIATKSLKVFQVSRARKVAGYRDAYCI